MNYHSLFNIYTSKIQEYIGEECPVHLYWKGRVALYAILKALGIGPGDEVILPAYTCVVVPNAIIYLGAKPVYIDIKPETYNIDPQLISASITNKTRAVISQNVYGLTADLDEISTICKQDKLYLIEDCCHGFGGMYHGKPNGTYGDAVFFSTQWNKPYSTGIGGFVVSRHAWLNEKLSRDELALNNPSSFERISLALQYLVQGISANAYLHSAIVSFYRLLSRAGLVIGSSTDQELTSLNMPQEYFKGVCIEQIRKGIKSISVLSRVMTLRKGNGQQINEFLYSINKNHVPLNYLSDHSFLRFPLLVKDRRGFIQNARRKGLVIGDWFNSPLHPIQGDLSIWGYNRILYPIASWIAEHMVNLPTDLDNNSKLIDFLSDNCCDIIGRSEILESL